MVWTMSITTMNSITYQIFQKADSIPLNPGWKCVHKCLQFSRRFAAPTIIILSSGLMTVQCCPTHKHHDIWVMLLGYIRKSRGWGVTARAHVRTPILFLGNGVADFSQTWCMAMDHSTSTHPQARSGVSLHVCIPILLFRSGLSDFAQFWWVLKYSRSLVHRRLRRFTGKGKRVILHVFVRKLNPYHISWPPPKLSPRSALVL